MSNYRMPCIPKIMMIAAIDANNGLGAEGKMPWHLPDDFSHFKQATLGKSVVMGRKTAQSLGRALPKRQNLVLSRNGTAPFAGQKTYPNLSEVLQACSSEDEIAVIGGGEIYKQVMSLADRLLITHIHGDFPGVDAWFPFIDPAVWSVVSSHHHPTDDRHLYAFDIVEYHRK